MKKFILIAIFVSVVVTSAAYYYFFIIMAQDESKVLPSKVKIAIKLPEITVTEKTSEKTKQKEEKQKEIPKAVIDKKQEMPKVEDKKEVAKKQEKPEKKETKIEGNQVAKTPPRDILPQKTQKKIIGYRLEYYVGNDEEASKIKEELIGKGYHTAKKTYWGKKYYVVIAPFTDKWEAEYVKSGILKETNKNFTVKPVYR